MSSEDLKKKIKCFLNTLCLLGAIVVVIVWWLNLQLPMQSVVISHPVHEEVYSMQNYVIKFVSDLRQVGGFLRFPPPIKLTATIYLKYC